MKTNHTKDEQSKVRGIEESRKQIKQIMNRHICTVNSFIGDNGKNHFPLVTKELAEREEKIITHLQEQHEAQMRELVEECLDAIDYSPDVTREEIKTIAARHGLSTKEN